MKGYIFLACVALTVVFSCKSGPGRIDPPAQSVSGDTPGSTASPNEPAAFDPSTISKEVFDSTKTDVQHLIEDLNGIIRAKNYKAWTSHLGEAYVRAKSDPEFLAETSAILMESRIESRRRVLNSLEDYFLNVVVPSRQNDRVDDIEFVGENRVKAYTITDKGRLRLYDLENPGDGWKIIN
jgi:hypothetical protein